jgi:ABC-type lipoprotein release transport system permease subunit
MGRILLVCRLAARDLRRRPAEAALLLLALTAATTTLTLGLVLHAVTSQPYERTREATAGPDVVASVAPRIDAPADLAGLTELAKAPGVVAHSGPYPYTQVDARVDGATAPVWAQGRDTDPAQVDQPALTEGSWIRDGGAVIEATLAQALGIRTGDQITLDGHTFQVAGIAVTTATPPYPKACFAPCLSGAAEQDAERAADGPAPPNVSPNPQDTRASEIRPSSKIQGGLIWLTKADASSLVTQEESLSYVMYLKLADPADAPSFVNAHLRDGSDTIDGPSVTSWSLASWQEIRHDHSWLVEKRRNAMLLGSVLLGLIALASITVLVGGRMADQVRRVGLLKAVGGTPSVVAAVLLAEHIAVALLATAAGLAVGRLTAPLLTDPGAGLIGSVDTVPVTISTVALVTAAALGIAAGATFVPALRAARTSTISALADTPRPPRRIAWLIALSARLPVPLLLAVRLAARRPRRTALGIAAVTITVTGIVAMLAVYARRRLEDEWTGGADPRLGISQALMLITIMLIVQAAVNAICIVWATTLDTRRSSALARALGATPARVSAGLSAAQALPALAGAMLGVAGGIGLAEILDNDPVAIPPLWQLLAVILGSVVVITVLTAIPARIGARRPAGEILQTERT